MLKIKHLLSPLNTVIFLYIGQFVIWYLAFINLKDNVYMLDTVPVYITMTSFLKYFVFFIIYVIAILFGISIAKYHSYSKDNFFKRNFLNFDTRLYNKIFSNLGVIFFIISSIAILYNLKNGISIATEMEDFKGMAPISSQLMRESFSKTFINFMTTSNIVFLYFYLTKKNTSFGKLSKKMLIMALFFSLVWGIFSQRTFLIVQLLIIVLFGARKRSNKKISFFKIIMLVLLLFSFIFAFELSREGVLNAIRKNIEIFSLENFFYVITHLLCAYLGKDFNNAMIIFDSRPSYALASTGSNLIQNILYCILGKPLNFSPVIDPGPYGTVNYLALIWLDWGWFGLIIVCFFGFLAGYYYYKYVYSDHISLTSAYMYVLFFIGTINSIRVNFFFLNIFIYPIFVYFIALMLTFLLSNITLKETK